MYLRVVGKLLDQKVKLSSALVEEGEALAGSPWYLTWWMQKWVPVVQHLQLGILREIEDEFFFFPECRKDIPSKH